MRKKYLLMVWKSIFSADYRFMTLAKMGFYNSMPDDEYLKRMYKSYFGKDLNLDVPTTFNEKLQWLKIHDRKSQYTMMVDKYESKKFIASVIGDQFVFPTIGVWEKFEDINFDTLPNQFVLKCTHDSGGLIICRDKEKFNKRVARKKINGCLRHNYFWFGREWPYKNVKPRIIAEKYMEDSITHDLRDYKFFTFNGVSKALFIATDRQTKGENTKFDFFDMDFKHLNIRNGHPSASTPPKKPENFEKMRLLAERLSVDIPQLRIDFYEVNGRAYVGELTFSHWSGFIPFEPEEWDRVFGDWIKLPQ